jgi:Kdo2-lipid IVA lauroyltransferase/acyltransferase
MIDPRHTSNAVAWVMRKIGPRLKGHRVARANLVAAYPEKSAAEIERILRGMWDNLARVCVEYGHLDQLWDFDRTGAKPGHILVEGDDRRRFLAALSEKGPALFFGAHLGNWELLPFAIGSHPGETAVVYRPSQIASIERELSKIRAASKAGLIRANLHAFFLAREMLRRDGIIGIVVDEHFPRGIDVKFFGRLCKVTPIFARLARQFDCPIYGGVVVRMSDQKFRLRVAGPLAAPRDADGKIDVASTMQMITELIEGWIKEHPEQWLWLQRRWR